MNHYLPLIIALIVIVVMGVGIFLLHEYVDYKVDNDYRNLPTSVKVGSGSGMKSCPNGCIRGTCNYQAHCRDHMGANPQCCAFDFQCQYCKDNNGEYYLKPDYNPYIDSNYSETPSELSTVEELNEAIAEQNRYIRQLNKDIRRKNKEIMNRTAPFSRT